MAPPFSLRLLGRGNNGAVVRGPPGTVYKWTVDPTEIACSLALWTLRDEGYALPGAPEVFDIRLGEREAVIHREDLVMAGNVRATTTLDPLSIERLQRGTRMLAAGRVSHDSRLVRRGRTAIADGLTSPSLRAVRDVITTSQERFGFAPLDIRPANLGTRRDGSPLAVLADLGRAPLETLTVSRGEAHRRCPNETTLVAGIRRLLGVAPSYSACRIASEDDLRTVMRKHGWADAEIDGTIGFHSDDKCSGLFRKNCRPGDILLREGYEASVLHELVHAAGVVDKYVSVWLCEGITEATAQDIATALKVPQHPTYPAEVRCVRDIVLPAMQAAGRLPAAPNAEATPVMALAHGIVLHPNRTVTAITQSLDAQYGGGAASWYNVVGPAATSVRHFELYVDRRRENNRKTRR